MAAIHPHRSECFKSTLTACLQQYPELSSRHRHWPDSMLSTTTAFHPTGITVEIVGTESNTQGRSCEEHNVCGSVMADDVVVRFRKVQIIVDKREESAIAVYHVSDGIDRCRVGFLKRHLLKHWKQYDGMLAQVIEVYSKESESPTSRRKFHHNKGCCVAAVISSLSDDTINQISNRKRSADKNPDYDDDVSQHGDSCMKRQQRSCSQRHQHYN